MLKLQNIVKNYLSGNNEVNALKNVSINFRKNEFVSILGPSGCGKTTLLNIIGGLDKYTSGDLIIDGVSTKNYKDRDWDTYRNHKIGFVFQSYNLIPHLNVLKNVEIALSMNNVKAKERKEKAIKALKEVGLEDQIYKKPNQLSGGQMQRVAIARALANDPEIILADEPTGALDTKTSVQIMDLLKKISKQKLIIMVTHNNELADTYSNRIIKLLDGEIVDDSKPLLDEETKEKKTSEKSKRKTNMGFFTALGLSFKNLLTKKGRTFLTSFAGSIGIIGVALVLAISNGFTNYINTLQSDTLADYPISVATAVLDYSSLASINPSQQQSSQEAVDYVVPYKNTGFNMNIDKYISFGHYNYLGEDLLNAIDELNSNTKNRENINLIQYNYFLPLKVISKDSDGKYIYTENKNTVSILSNFSTGIFNETIKDDSFLLSNYDVIYTSNDYQTNSKYELTLVVEDGNQINGELLELLGLKLTKQVNKYNPVDYEDICNQELKVVFNDNYYTYDNQQDMFSVIDTENQTTLSNLYDSSTKTLKITRIIRKKQNATLELISSSILYSNDFATEYLQNCAQSEIATKQQERTNAENYNFYAPFEISIKEVPTLLDSYENSEKINSFLEQYFKCSLSNEEAYSLGMQQIGSSKIPQSIIFYPKNFEGKQAVTNLIDEYNLDATDSHKIVKNETTNALMNMLNNLINIISYVLIAFASISLVVSSIMIGIITYVSVIERTKEIGVLRSIGARKKDISRVFNAETLIIGFMAGAIGVGVSYIFCPIISLIVNNLTSASISNIAMLNPLHAVILIAISMLLTLISGSIPSRIASKKDPVVCLRTE